MSLTSIFQTAKLALEMAEDAEKAADDEAKAKAARGTLAATKVSTIHAKAVVDSVYVMLELDKDKYFFFIFRNNTRELCTMCPHI